MTDRRDFIKTTGAAALTTSIFTGRVRGANDRIRVAFIGMGRMGTESMQVAMKQENVEVPVLCDVYQPNLEKAIAISGRGPDGTPDARSKAKGVEDFRKVLEDKTIDAVNISTPDHWHAYMTVEACKNGKDVYVEKPLAHNIREGRAMVTAARRYNRIVQTGTQHRSAPHYREVQRIIQSGELGEVRFVRVWNYSNLTPYGIGRAPEAAPPAGLDWDLYLGPAPKVPYRKTRFMRSFRWFWDYAGGTITDFGTHRFDTVHQIMGVDAPKTVAATGGRFIVKDDGEMPELLQVTYEYPNFVLSYEACNFNAHGMGGRTSGMNYYSMRDKDDRPHGEAFYGTNGALFSDRIGFEIYPERKAMSRKDGSQDVKTQVVGYRMEGKRVQSKDATGLHAANFIECVRSRKLPAGDIEIGHRSTIIPHLGNIAYKTGKKLTWDAAREDFVGEPEASKLLGRKARKPWDLI